VVSQLGTDEFFAMLVRRITEMSSIRSIFWVGLLGFGLTATTTAQAVNQMYLISDVSWTVKAFGNECSDAVDPTPGPHCGGGESESDIYGAVGLPQGIQCNGAQPRCPFESTPTDGQGNFAPLGGSQTAFLHCAPWADWQGNGTTARPGKGETAYYTGRKGGRIPPLYRNPAFFTPGGAPGTTWCTAISTGFTPVGKGRVQAGNPVTGFLAVSGTGGANGGFDFSAALASTDWGLRATGVAGEFVGLYPYGYRYTYATLRNASGSFGPGRGPGSFSLARKNDGIYVKQGAAKFGGTMQMLGAMTSKSCYYRNGGCSFGSNDWHYDLIGTLALTSNGVVTNGYVAVYNAYYYHTALRQTSTVRVEGSFFPWTTGSVTVTAVGRGPHNTIHYAQGYDNRETTRTGYPYAWQVGTLQLVSPVLTRWLQPAVNFETTGIGILRFAPEPHGWVMLVAGMSLFGVGYRMRKPASAARDGR
jgi:hypothetical protein